VDTGPSKQVLDWAGGTLDDLVALLSGPAWSARIEVLPASGGNAVGEVQVIAGGVSDAIFEGKSTHESLDKLRAVPNAKFRIEPRLPNPANGDLAAPGPEQGKLEERPLATLMRYCEEFVLTAGIEVWRASENAKVEYKRGEIVGVTVGGIDAPERLAEVMKWSSGSYRLVVPKLSIPDKAPKAAAPPAVVAPRSMGAASKTIFGMPALDPAAIAAAADKARLAKSGSASGSVSAPGVTAPAPLPGATAAAAPPATPSPSAPGLAAAPAAVPPARPAASGRSATTGPSVAPTPPVVAPAAPQAQPAVRASTNRTIFGVAAPPQPSPTPSTSVPAPAAARPSTPAAAAPAASPPATPTGSGAAARPTTAVSIPAVAAPPPATARTTSPAPTPAPSSTAVAKTNEKTEKAPAVAKKQKSQPPATTTEESNLPAKAKPKSAGTPVWTYVGVGFVFGLALLGVYRLVMILAH